MLLEVLFSPFQRKKNHINISYINKFGIFSWDWVVFWGSFLIGDPIRRENTHTNKQTKSPENPGTIP